MKTQILQDWLLALSLRYQGVIITSIRGCDLAQKEDPAKAINRFIRRACLNPFDAREVDVPGSFFYVNLDLWQDQATAFLRNLDGYPLHYVMHIIHAMEIIGYERAPEDMITCLAGWFYDHACEKLHMNPETRGQQKLRLEEDRVANGTVAQ